MKKFHFTLACFLLSVSFAFTSSGQYTITGYTVTPSPVCSTGVVSFDFSISAYTHGLMSKTYFGDGTSVIDTVFGTILSIRHTYHAPGTYTIKEVLSLGGVGVDSIVFSRNIFSCQALELSFYNDIYGTCAYANSGQLSATAVFRVEVDSAGIAVDTLLATSGFYYNAYGPPGTIYAFKAVSTTGNVTVACPISAIIYDTISGSLYCTPKYFGARCPSSPTGFDLAVNAIVPVTGVSDQWGNVFVTNSYCTPTNAVVTLTFSSKYSFPATFTPASISGNTITWNLTGLTSLTKPVDLYYSVREASGPLTVRDTVHEFVQVTPITGDSNPANNTELVIDTVKAGVDPNAMMVTPSGYITAGTQLKYTIAFENTGNDTAYNISVYDTLSDNVDVKSLNLVMASAVMNISQWNDGMHNIVKFDFPNINLLDSSHHGQCDGAIIFTINSKAGLANGIKIDNRAGIYFDYNPVVMTNTVENIIGIPSKVENVRNAPNVEVFPNPARDELTFRTSSTSYATVAICNMMGQQVLEQTLTGSTTTLSVQSLPTGVYYATLRSDADVQVVKFEKR